MDQSHKLALPSAISAVVARLQAIERSTEVSPALLPKVRLRTASGPLAGAPRVHGCRVRAPGADRRDLRGGKTSGDGTADVQAYDLSKRESEIMQSVLRGLSTAEMVATFQISSNTVQEPPEGDLRESWSEQSERTGRATLCPAVPATSRSGSRLRRQWVVHLNRHPSFLHNQCHWT